MFIGVFTTVGFLSLGLFSSAIFLVMKNQNHSTFQTRVGKLVSDYATFIHKIPFYNFDYLSKIKPLWNAFKETPSKSIADYVTFATTFCQLIARAVVSYPIAWWYNQPQNQAADRIHLLIKGKISDAQLKKIDKDITIQSKQYKEDKHQAGQQYTHLTIPRYEAFADIIKKLVKHKVHIQKIAGQDSIQVKVVATEAQNPKLDKFNTLYSYQNHLDTNKTVLLDVPAKEMNNTINTLNKARIGIKLMHDF
jgi:hypothetical protein